MARPPLDRREFLKVVGAGAGLALGARTSRRIEAQQIGAARSGAQRAQPSPEIVVVGAGAFGQWTALHLQRLGARVLVVDAYGPANSRATSGGETRGVRSSYGDRPHGLQWARWAKEAAKRWRAWDEEGKDRLLPRLFFETGDLILRDEVSPYIEDTRANWDAMGARYEVLSADEIRRRWPQIRFENLAIALFEPDAGVVRARRAIESVARVFEHPAAGS